MYTAATRLLHRDACSLQLGDTSQSSLGEFIAATATSHHVPVTCGRAHSYEQRSKRSCQPLALDVPLHAEADVVEFFAQAAVSQELAHHDGCRHVALVFPHAALQFIA